MKTCVTMTEGVGLRSAASTRQALLDALNKDEAVEIALPTGAVVDLCGLQLIEAARIHASALGKRLTLAPPADDKAATDLRGLLDAAGFLTEAAPETLKFWLPEGDAQ